MMTVSSPCTLSALCPAAVIARKYGLRSPPSRNGRRIANRLAAVVERGVDARRVARARAPATSSTPVRVGTNIATPRRLLADTAAGSGRRETPSGSLFDHLHLRRLLRIERVHLEDVGESRYARVERRIDGRRQPDEPAADALAEREAQLELRRRLVDLVDDERVVRRGCRLPRTIAARCPVVTMMTFHVGVSGVASRSRLTTPTFSASVVPRISSAIGRIASVFPVPVPATMPKPLPRARELAHAFAVMLLEKRLDVETQRQLDRLARGARRRDDDDASRRRLGATNASWSGGS